MYEHKNLCLFQSLMMMTKKLMINDEDEKLPKGNFANTSKITY